MTKAKRLVVLALSLLTACTKPAFVLTDVKQVNVSDGIYQRQVELVMEKQTYGCFIELENQQMTGVSCQNELGFSEFSAGHDDKTTALQFELVNPTLNETKARFIMDLLRLSLFDTYQVDAQEELQINKEQGNVLIINADNQQLFRVRQ